VKIALSRPAGIVRRHRRPRRHLDGGGALLKNLDKLLRRTNLPITVAEAAGTVVLGSGKVLDNIELLKDVVIN
jgi:rod shape-determining protein MreB